MGRFLKLAAATLGASVAAVVAVCVAAVKWFDDDDPDRRPVTDADWDELVVRYGIPEAD